MKRTEPLAISEIINDFINKKQLATAIVEGNAKETWSEIVGEYIAKHTTDVFLKSRILTVRVSSSAARAEVHMRRRYYIQELNMKLGAGTVVNIILKM